MLLQFSRRQGVRRYCLSLTVRLVREGSFSSSRGSTRADGGVLRKLNISPGHSPRHGAIRVRRLMGERLVVGNALAAAGRASFMRVLSVFHSRTRRLCPSPRCRYELNRNSPRYRRLVSRPDCARLLVTAFEVLCLPSPAWRVPLPTVSLQNQSLLRVIFHEDAINIFIGDTLRPAAFLKVPARRLISYPSCRHRFCWGTCRRIVSIISSQWRAASRLNLPRRVSPSLLLSGWLEGIERQRTPASR